MEAIIQMLFFNNIHIDYNKANNRAYIATLKKSYNLLPFTINSY